MVRSDRPTLLAVSVNPEGPGRDFGQGSAPAGCVEGFSTSLLSSSHKGRGAGLMAPPWHNTLCLLGTDGCRDKRMCSAGRKSCPGHGAVVPGRAMPCPRVPWAVLSIAPGTVVGMGSTWGHLRTEHPALCPGLLEQ